MGTRQKVNVHLPFLIHDGPDRNAVLLHLRKLVVCITGEIVIPLLLREESAVLQCPLGPGIQSLPLLHALSAHGMIIAHKEPEPHNDHAEHAVQPCGRLQQNAPAPHNTLSGKNPLDIVKDRPGKKAEDCGPCSKHRQIQSDDPGLDIL